MAIGDINGDGLPDVITGNFGYSAPAKIFVLYNAADGSRFTHYDEIAPGSPYILKLFAADLNGDHRTDIIATTSAFGTPGVLVFYNTGAGLGNAVVLPAQVPTEAVGIGDV